MTTIKFNDNAWEVASYSKNTYFNGETITSNASCGLKVTNTNELQAMAPEPITTIKILKDDTVIYDLEDIDARIENINEYLDTDHMSVTVNLIFNI